MTLLITGQLEMIEGVFDVDISVDHDGWRNAVPDLEMTVRLAAEAALRACGYEEAKAELSVLMTDNRTIADLNENWRGKSGPTNVLSFSGELGGPGPALLGDIVLAIEIVIAEAKAGGITVSDHVAHLVVHGVLHLLGHDHQTDSNANIMERLETKILATLGVSDPYVVGRNALSGIST
jgi:probable rRNA maturation factor